MDKTATERLRELLSEKGIEWEAYTPTTTAWGEGEDEWRAWEVDGTLYVERPIETMTPEQAIEATLGRGECHDEGFAPYFFDCSNCGASHLRNVAYVDMPNYCPNCGAKVVRS